MSSEEHHPALAPLSWLFGVWESIEAEVDYPSTKPLKYKEIMEYLPSTAWPALEYKSDTFYLDKKDTKIHCERGYLSIDPESKRLALMSSHIFGLNELAEGTVENESLSLESQSFSSMSFLKCQETQKVIRKFWLKDGVLHHTIQLQTDKYPLQSHIQSRYKKRV